MPFLCLCFFSSLNEVKVFVAFVQCRLIYPSNLVSLIRDLGEYPFCLQVSTGLKKKNKTKKAAKLLESSISGWVHILAGSWFIYCIWPGWLLELWRYSECCRKSAAENVRHSACLGQMQVQDYTGSVHCLPGMEQGWLQPLALPLLARASLELCFSRSAGSRGKFGSFVFCQY